jgi:hypothetical protein
LRLKHHRGEDVQADIQDEAEVLSGLSEEGSVYDSEEDRKTLKEAKKRRKAEAAIEKSGSKKQRKNASIRTVCPESVANDGDQDLILEDFLLGTSTSRCGFTVFLDIR